MNLHMRKSKAIMDKDRIEKKDSPFNFELHCLCY